MGAQCTPKVQKFLSFVDMLPAPVMKYGSKTLYEKPNQDEKNYELGRSTNPYRFSKRMEYFLEKVLEQEQTSYFTRKQLMSNEVYKQLFLNADKSQLIEYQDDQEVLQKEINELKEDLKKTQLENSVEGHKQEILVQRINKVPHPTSKASERTYPLSARESPFLHCCGSRCGA